MIKSDYKYLIIGQGLAGSLLAWHLEEAQEDYLVVDIKHHNSASDISAGIVNPLIGQSFNLSWNFIELNNFAKKFYQNLEVHFKTNFITDIPILRALTNPKQKIILEQKLKDPIYQKFIGSTLSEYRSIKFKESAFLTKQSYWLDIAKVVREINKFLKLKNRFLELNFNYQKLKKNKTGYLYENINFKKIIFAEGYRAIYNPFASFLDFRPAKGEILDLEIPNLDLDLILNFGHFILPLQNNIYRLGATYAWSDWEQKSKLDQEHPLLLALKTITQFDYKIINHHLGVRPIVSGQKPVIGGSPEDENLYFINGLGSKGALQAPYCSWQLVNHLLNNTPILPEISSNRFPLKFK